MAILLLILTIAGFAALGYWRGGLRFGLALLPLLLASTLLWLLAAPVYEITVHFGVGLIWPALIIVMAGLATGYTARYFLSKKLPSERKMADRVSGAVVGMLVGLVAFELGLIYMNVRAVSNDGAVAASRTNLARSINNTVVRWIPGVGAGSDAMTDLMIIAAAPEPVRQRAIDRLEIDHLTELPAMQDLMNDPETAADIEAAATGDLLALYRLQKNPFVLALGEDEEFMDAVRRISLSEIAVVIRDAQQAAESETGETP